MIRNQVGDLSSHTTKYSFHALTQKQADDVADEGAADVDVDVVLAVADEPSITSPTPTTQPPPPSQELPSTSQVLPTLPPSPIAQPPSPQQQPQPSHDAESSMDLLHTLLETCTTLTRRVEHLEQDKIAQTLEITKLTQKEKKLERTNKLKVSKLRILKKVGIAQRVDTSEDTVMDDDDELEPAELKEVVKVVTTAKLMTEVVTAASATITAASATITAATTPINVATITVAPSAARRRKGVVIKDPEETATPSIIIHFEPKSKDKGKMILLEESKPLKKQAQIEQDEAYARELEAELNKNINWDDKYFNPNVVFLEKTKEQLEEEEDSKSLKRKTESQVEKAAKKQKLDKEVEELKKHLQIVPNDEDDVYTEATPLARKVPVVDYEIYTENNKPYYKIIRADGSPQLFLSFLSLLRNFDREDLEVLWQLVKERFASSKPKNFLDDFLLTTLTYMFEKPDVQAQVWKNQRTVHGLAKCMRTRSSSNLPVESPPNPSTSNPKHRNYRRSKQPFILEESPVDTMADQRTMVELLRALTEGYAEAIMVPSFLAEQFELKHSFINMMTSDQFFRLEKDNPHDHIRWFNKITSTIKYKDVPNSSIKLMLFPFSLTGAARRWLEKEPPRFILTWEDLVSKFINEFFPPQEQQISQTSAVTTTMTAILKQFQATSPPAFVKAVEETCVTCGGAHPYYQCLATDGNTFPELRDNIQGYVAAAAFNYNRGNFSYRPPGVANQIRPLVFAQPNVQNNQNRFIQPQGYNRGNNFNQDQPYQAPTQPNQVVPLSELEKIKRVNEANMKAMQTQINYLHINITLADALILIPKYQKILRALLSNKEKLIELANTPLNENCSAVILKKLPEKLGDPGKFLNLCGFSELKCKALADLGASINLILLSFWKNLGLPKLISTRMTLELANRAICTPARIARDVFIPVGKFTFPAYFVIVDYESDPRVLLILGRPFLRTARALIDVHGEEMILRDGDKRLTLNMRHDTSSYSNQPQKESINMINIYDDSSEDFLKKLCTTNHKNGSPTFSSHPELASSKVKDDVFDPEGGNDLIEKFLDLDSTKDLHPPHRVSTTSSSSPNHLLEEFVDELTLITLPPRNDDLSFDIESNLKVIEYMLHHDPIKDIDSILKDSIDQSKLVDLNDNLVDIMPEMFTDEHALDYSSPLIYDEYDDDLFEVESDTKYVYDDPFDSKGEKIKESKLLIDEIDLPSDFLPSFEYDSFLSEDFSMVDALPSTNNEDK
nr:reverse transcriptase domain-containing protein [Tanacetum cinerariifolium]